MSDSKAPARNKQSVESQEAHLVGERQFVAAVAHERGLSTNLENAELALERLEQHKQEISRLQFLALDAQRELVSRIVEEGWIDLLRVNVSGFKRRMRHVRNGR
jgi:hypothetical protein